MIWAKVNTSTNVIETTFIYDEDVLPDYYGNPIHYVQVPEGVSAEIGGTYDRETDIWLPKKIYPSWVLNDDGKWEAPVPKPEDFNAETNKYIWNEQTQSWDPV